MDFTKPIFKKEVPFNSTVSTLHQSDPLICKREFIFVTKKMTSLISINLAFGIKSQLSHRLLKA